MTKSALMWKWMAIISVLSAVVPAAVVHRYSFTGNANDSLGTANGVLVNNSGLAAYSSGQLDMGNSSLPSSTSSTINYVDLPNGVISSLGTQATFEAWVTWAGTASSSWQRIFDFGTSDTGENFSTSGSSSTYIFMTPYSGSGTYRVGYRMGSSLGTTSERTIDNASALPTNTQVHVALTWNDTTSQANLYLNGALIGTNTTHFLLSQMQDNNNWLGRSQWPDPAFNGKYNEFRIHNIAMTDAQISSSYSAGPDTVGGDYLTPCNPSPANGSQSVATNLLLSWQSDTNAAITGHRIYLGTDYTSVLNATPSSTGIYLDTVPALTTSYQVALQPGTQYYWRIEEVLSTGATVSGAVWAFETYNPKAHTPSPADGTTGISVSGVTLQWVAGGGAVSHRVYFGTSPETLQLMEDYYSSTSWPTGALNFSKTYYWRIDERQSGGAIITGDVWSFTSMQGPQSCIPGDLDGDCFVGIEDLLLFAAQWLDNTDCSAFDCPDLDQNQHVNLSDVSILASNWQQEHEPLVVINEIHYHSDNNTEPVEFIELYNAGAVQIDLSGWKVEDAVTYTFPANIFLEPGGYAVVSQNPAAITAKFGVSSYGPWTGKLSNDGERIVLSDAAGNKVDEVNYGSAFPWPTAANGDGASMELLNPYLDNDLGGSWRPSGYHSDESDLAFGAPTPGRINSVYVYTENAPPQIRQVNHQAVNPVSGQDPQQPRAGQSVIVTAKVTDPDGVQQVVLKYQIVAPGAYIPAYLPVTPISSLISNPHQRKPLNPDFENAANWTTVAMVDDGSGQDVLAGDGIYTAVIPGQTNRTLVRYRIETQDQKGHSVRVPYYDDGSLNFACFVYNGVPAYVANTDTVQTAAPYTYSADIMTSIPVYFLITRVADLYQCNGYNSADRIDQGSPDYNLQEAGKAHNWEGTFIYDGKVYDHIAYRLHGGNGRYNYGSGGKRSMKFRFNCGNYFQARDIYGQMFPSKWHHLVTGKMFGNRLQGRYGVNELMDMRMWNLVGVPAPEGWWFTFRVIDGTEEAPSTTTGQYDGDFWGLYLGWEDYDGAFLGNHGLPDGNLYKLSDKIYEGLRQQQYQGPDADVIQNYMDTDEWARYHTIIEAVRSYDIFSGPDCWHCLKNSAWYFYPEYTAANNYKGRWWIMPFDVDDTWGPFFNQGIDHGAAAIFDQYYVTEGQPVQLTIQPAKAPIKQDYRNYMREFRDLHWQTGIINPMVDEMAKVIEKLVPADRDRWRLNTSPEVSRDDGTLAAGVADMKTFAWTGGSWTGDPWAGDPPWPGTSANLDNLANAESDSTNIPNTPMITYTGQTGYPSNALTFSTSAFSDPQGNTTFAALKWRIAEYETITIPSSSPTEVVYVDKGATWRYFKGTVEPSTTTGDWRPLTFNDTSWLQGPAPFGYDPTVAMGTSLADMASNPGYNTFYLRKTFTVTNPVQINSIRFEVLFDDGFNLWINGHRVLYDNVPAENLPYNTLLTDYGYSAREDNSYAVYTVTNISQYLVAGTNQIAVHVVNHRRDSSDCFFDMKMTGVGTQPISTQTTLPKHPFEIQPVWESDDITPFAGTVQIPGSAVKSGHLYRVRCKMKDTTGRWSHWSSPVEFTAGTPLAAGVVQNLKLTELMYNPAAANTAKGELNLDNNEFEFIELKNATSDQTLDISGVSITNGVTFSFSSAPTALKSLAPGQFVLVVKDQAAFESRYGTTYSSRIAGAYTGKLANEGEQVTISDYWNGTIVSFNYSDSWGWPKAADGAGHSLVPVDSAIPNENLGSLKYGPNWRASAKINGSPGQDDVTPAATVVVNELRAHTDYSDPAHPEYDSNDWIELYNTTASAVTLTNYYLSDDADNLKKWQIGGYTISGHQRLSFDEVNNFHNPITSGFGLDKAGEYVFLSYLPGTAEDRVVDCIHFNGQENLLASGQEASFGRYPDGEPWWFAMVASRDIANLTPFAHLVISEIMYHPLDTAVPEYVELYNPTAAAVSLMSEGGAWRLNGQAVFTFPTNVSVPAYGRIVIVGFDPTVVANLNAFIAQYGTGSLTAGVNIFGPWTGTLDNDTGRIAVEKSLLPDASNPAVTPWVTVDEVLYFDRAPWPTESDGDGKALGRISSSASASGDNPANWNSVTPSPGG
jgi:hypothetical protein